MTEKTPEMEAAVLSEAAVAAIPEGEEEAAVAEVPRPKIDLAAFLAGVTPAKRAVRLYGNGGARADLDVIDRQIDEAKARQQQVIVNRLQKERVAAIHALKSENVMDFTLNGWAPHRHDEFKKQLDAEKVASNLERNLRTVSAQVAEIDGVDVTDAGVSDIEIYELLMDLHEVPGMQSQIGRLVRVCAELNVDPEQITIPLS